jgi:hypothetical protein
LTVLTAAFATGGAACVRATASNADPVALAERLSVARPASDAARGNRDPVARVAKRLQARIERRFNRTASVASLRAAVAERRSLFSHAVSVSFVNEGDGTDVAHWNVSLGQYPEWVMFTLKGGPQFVLDVPAIERHLAVNPPDGLSAPSFARVVETKQDGKVLRAGIEGEPKDGQTYDNDDVVQAIVTAYKRFEPTASVDVAHIRGAVLYDDGTTTHVLHELGVGRSVFDTSPWGRKQNVRKAMNEKANGVVIPQGDTFSYNATLGGPVTYSNGWFDSLIIVNGSTLEPAPGGGICQSATTVYRAAMAAGLPIVTRKSHSLYVHYYKAYGVGLDATVFPGKQDMTFQNDTPGPLILVGKTDADDNAFSMLYGIDDGRDVSLDGPYFGYTYTEPVMGRTLRSSEVAWIKRVTMKDGSVREQLQVAQYGKLPKSVALEFTPAMHGAADLVADAR